MAPDNASMKKTPMVGIDAAFICVTMWSDAMRGSNNGRHSPVRRSNMAWMRRLAETSICLARVIASAADYHGDHQG